MWDTDNLKVTLDLCTFCNAGCPQCHRTNSKNNLQKKEWLPLVQWSLNDFKKAFSPEDVKKVKDFKFVGSWGDSIMMKDIFEIVEYILNSSKFVTVQIETNGSIRDEEWWWNFGIMGGRRLNVRFDVDGINQEMHSKYRRFTDLNKVLNNMKTFASTYANAKTQTVVFKHNQDYLDEIKELCIKNGSKFHTNVISDRFDRSEIDENGNYPFINENGEKEVLEPANRDCLTNPFIPGAKPNQLVLDNQIKCRWALPRNDIIINPLGQVVPCCYIDNGYFKSNYKDNTDWINSPHWKDYTDNKEDYNIFNHTLKEIVDGKWFTKTLPESFKSEKPLWPCERQCSNRAKKEHQLREEINVTTN